MERTQRQIILSYMLENELSTNKNKYRNQIIIMAVWKNIKCPGCKKPNGREELKARKGVCIHCGFKIVSNLSIFVNNGSKPVVVRT